MKKITIAALSALVLVACVDNDGLTGVKTVPDAPAFSNGASTGSIEPDVYSGNISGGAAGVCATLDATALVGAKWEDTDEDPLAGRTFESNGFSFEVSADGKYLEWRSDEGDLIRTVVVKGGNGYHDYSYDPPNADGDSDLHSPLNNGLNVPAISWFAFCYEEAVAEASPYDVVAVKAHGHGNVISDSTGFTGLNAGSGSWEISFYLTEDGEAMTEACPVDLSELGIDITGYWTKEGLTNLDPVRTEDGTVTDCDHPSWLDGVRRIKFTITNPLEQSGNPTTRKDLEGYFEFTFDGSDAGMLTFTATN